MNKQQEAFANIDQKLGHLLVQIDTLYQSLPKSIQKAYDNLGSSLQFGCHCDLDDDMEPDNCVLIDGDILNCVYAKKGMRPEQCQYWKPVITELNDFAGG